MAKKDKSISVNLEEQKDGVLQVFIGKKQVGEIKTKENIVAKLDNGLQFEGKTIDEVLAKVIAEYNLHG